MSTQSDPRILSSSWWDAISHLVTSTMSVPRTPQVAIHGVGNLSESLFASTSQEIVTTSHASESTKRPGAWLEGVVKRKEAAEDTIKRRSQGLETLLTDSQTSSKHLRSTIVPFNHCKTPPRPLRETRILPNVKTRSKKELFNSVQILPANRQTLQVVIPSHPHLISSPHSDDSPPERPMGSIFSDSSISQGGSRSSSMTAS